MSKELTPLEALSLLFELTYGYDTKPNSDYTWYANVETALKRLEKIETTTHSVLREDRKKLKALEIIKKKRVNVYELTRSMDCAEYNRMFDIEGQECFLSQEEYDLLKEVLK